MNSKAEQSPVPPLMPTTILPFIPSSVPAAHPPISMARAPHPVLLPSQMTPTSQSSFPFGEAPMVTSKVRYAPACLSGCVCRYRKQGV